MHYTQYITEETIIIFICRCEVSVEVIAVRKVIRVLSSNYVLFTSH